MFYGGEKLRNFGKKLEMLRKTRGITQEKLASDLNVSRQMIYYWESNSHNPGIDKLKKICEYFDVPSTYFLDEEEAKTIVNNNDAQEVAFSESDVKSQQTKPVAKKWKVIFGITLSVLIMVVGGLFLSIVLSAINIDRNEYIDYSYDVNINMATEYVVIYILLIALVIIDSIFLAISIKKLKRGKNSDKN